MEMMMRHYFPPNVAKINFLKPNTQTVGVCLAARTHTLINDALFILLNKHTHRPLSWELGFRTVFCSFRIPTAAPPRSLSVDLLLFPICDLLNLRVKAACWRVLPGDCVLPLQGSHVQKHPGPSFCQRGSSNRLKLCRDSVSQSVQYLR